MDFEAVLGEVSYKTVRSSGAGGQHVNKVASKVVLSFDLHHSKVFDEDQKNRLYQNLASRLTKENLLVLHCDTHRSQHRNKELVNKRLFEILSAALDEQKDRKSTKPTRASVRKRLDTKKKQSEKKKNRQKPKIN